MLLRDKLIDEGKEAHDLFDSNAISPGTKFMMELNHQLAFFIQFKLNTDPLYQKVSPFRIYKIHLAQDSRSFWRKCPRRRRAQNDGLRETSQDESWLRPKHQTLLLRCWCRSDHAFSRDPRASLYHHPRGARDQKSKIRRGSETGHRANLEFPAHLHIPA